MTAQFKVGDWVEVRSKEEILTTLDRNGQLDGMPFMPEMFAYCGKRFRVYKRAHKTCDTVFPTRGRRVERTVHLETRCDGSGHGGCQAGCLIFWKEAWLKPVVDNAADTHHCDVLVTLPQVASRTWCGENDVWRSAETSGAAGAEPTYHCQATRLPYATSHLDWWDVRQYIEDYQSGNVRLVQMFQALVYACYYSLSQAGIGLGPPMRWLYNTCHSLWGGPQFPRTSGTIPDGKPTPSTALDLQPGELVRVKSHEEILATLTVGSKNRGLLWDAEMVPYCGGTYRVLKRVTRIINENTGKMQDMKTPCIILDSVICQAKYSGCRTFCPRGIYPYWREIWLERVQPSQITDSGKIRHSSDAHHHESFTSTKSALVALSHHLSAKPPQTE
ncbi:MAG: hypothetical protein IT165_19555 [Bryobacterales bacterium]|nr:hypothetical protein [Bryobacterales bacterium]